MNVISNQILVLYVAKLRQLFFSTNSALPPGGYNLIQKGYTTICQGRILTSLVLNQGKILSNRPRNAQVVDRGGRQGVPI